MVFRVYKPLNTPLHYKDLCMIMVMEVDMYRMKKCKPPFTSLDSLIKLPRITTKPEVEKLERVPKKESVEIAEVLKR